jgi:hypothetical protein
MTKATKYFSGVVGAVLMCSSPLVQCFSGIFRTLCKTHLGQEQNAESQYTF